MPAIPFRGGEKLIHGGLWTKEVKEYRGIFFLCFLLAILLGIVFPFYFDRLLHLPAEIIMWKGLTASTFQIQEWMHWTSGALLQISVITAVILGYSTISREISGNTMLYLRSKPITPREIVITKAAVGITFMVFFVFGVSFAFWVFSWFISGTMLDPGSFFLSATVTLSVVAVAYTTALFFSSLFPRPWLAALFASALWITIFSPEFALLPREFSLFTCMRDAGFWLGQERAFIPIGAGIALVYLGSGLTLITASVFK